MKLSCPQCDSLIQAEDINIITDIAKCSACGSVFKVSELVEKPEPHKVEQLPLGAKLQVRKSSENTIELYYPKRGFSIWSLPIGIFAVIWISFVAFWTWGASQASVLFALFSIPFWLVGIAMVIGLINGASESQTIIIDRTILLLKKSRVFNPKTITVDINEIDSISMKTPTTSTLNMSGNIKNFGKQTNNSTVKFDVPTITSGIKDYIFFESATNIEQEWAVNFLQTVFVKIKKQG